MMLVLKEKFMKRVLITLFIVVAFTYAQVVGAEMTSTSYQIRWDTFSTGGSDSASSTSYQLRDTISGTAGEGTSNSYKLSDGYRAGVIDEIISFGLFIQSSSNKKQASSLVGSTVSVPNTDGLSVGNYVAVVQDLGGSQVIGFGKIESLGGSSVTLDFLTTGSSSPIIDGSNDYLYSLTSSNLLLETVSISSIGTGIVGFEMTIDNDNGYVIQILEDGNLRDGSNEINDVSDGEVTLGSEEFGARSSDSTLLNSTFDTQDTALTTSAQDIVTQSSFAIDNRSFLLFKISSSTATPSATYSNQITFIASGNF